MSTKEALGKTVSIKGKRYYIINKNTKYPSVTTVLGSMSDSTGLDKWRKRVGEEKADVIAKFSANRGTVMHQMAEYYLSCESNNRKDKLKAAQTQIIPFVREEKFTDEETIVGRKLFFNIYNNDLFSNIKEVVSLEDMLFSHLMGGYAGRVDVIYKNHQNQLIILDFKSAKKPKKIEWIKNYYMQISAYFIAYWEMTGEKPQGGEVWVSNESDEIPQVFKVTMKDIKKYGKSFLEMVKEYHNNYSLS